MRRLVWLFTLASCIEPAADPIEPQVTSGVVHKQIPIHVNRKIDLLLVIDNSPAMAAHQTRLKTNLRNFVAVLNTLEGGLPNLRLGVTTTDLGGEGCTATGDDGVLRGDPDVIGNFVVDFVGPDGIRLRNYRGDLADVVARLGDVGTAGCARTQPLAAARRAIENYANRSFLRDDSTLGVYIISALDAPDDVAAIDDHARFFRALHADPSRIVVAGILGELDPDARIPQFLDRFPHRNTRVPIDQEDWSGALQPFAELLKVTLGDPCIEGPLLDIDADRPGTQYACAAWYEFPVGGEVIPSCETAFAGPCWRIVPDRQACPTREGLLKIEQPRIDMPEQVMLNVECLSR